MNFSVNKTKVPFSVIDPDHAIDTRMEQRKSCEESQEWETKYQSMSCQKLKKLWKVLMTHHEFIAIVEKNIINWLLVKLI